MLFEDSSRDTSWFSAKNKFSRASSRNFSSSRYTAEIEQENLGIMTKIICGILPENSNGIPQKIFFHKAI